MLYALMEGATGEGVSWKSPSYIFTTYVPHACTDLSCILNPLAPELFFLILAHLYIKCE